MTGRSILGFVLTGLVLAGSLATAEEYDARVIEVGNGTFAQSLVSAPPAMVNFESNNFTNGWGTSSETTVDRGIVTEINHRVRHSDARGYQYWRSVSRMEFSDVVFSSPTADPISVSLNVYLSGTFTFTADTDNGGSSGSDFRAAILTVFVNTVDMGYFRPSDSDVHEGWEHGPLGGDGLFAGHSGNAIVGVFTTQPFTVLPNQPVTLEVAFWFDAWASESQAPGTFRQATVNFDTISFPPGGPVFDLPAGVDVDSVEAGIVDNVWQGSGSTGPGAVPDGNAIPGTPLLLDKDPSGDHLLTWSAGCSAAGIDYEIYRGTIGNWYDHAPEQCSTTGATSALVPAAPGNVYYLVVPTDGAEEGSHGRDSSGTERPPGLSSCLPRAVDTSCP